MSQPARRRRLRWLPWTFGGVGLLALAAVAWLGWVMLRVPVGGGMQPAGTAATLILFLTSAAKAVATELGVQIRLDARKVIDATETPDGGVPVVTSLATVVPVPADAVPTGSNLVAGDGLGGATITSAADAEDARVERGKQSTPEHREP